ncbi:helix-hairpin-helix domain-containing protein [Tropicimonas sp. TH_r6]|uniref:helix-hairpin-helix domain-containing protein n=1 Tax=Tropicimonas sp. TH_r6 TaxID=3082085 RepID=UPI002952CBEF|nr:helix-hairpin-helix domain-containing protein [Tropicimonas sp. TH_r6]MDV7145354.1 helix-hairpin-helix domain-containing protein [Tropicimonas sp. TH_r6]
MVSTSKVLGVGPAMEKALAEHGFASAEDMAAATPLRLKAVPGIGAATAPRLKAAAKAAVLAEAPVPDEKPPKGGMPKAASAAGDVDKKKREKPKKTAKKSKDKGKKKSKSKKKDKAKPAEKQSKKKSGKGKSRKKA